jgi:hypothetical protein
VSSNAKGPDVSIIGGKLHRLGFKTYAEYLASPHWRELKRRYLASSLRKHCSCGKPRRDFHHLTYERLGAEKLTDIEPLCRTCHEDRHRKARPKPHRSHGRKKKRRGPRRTHQQRERAKERYTDPVAYRAERKRERMAQALAEVANDERKRWKAHTAPPAASQC